MPWARDIATLLHSDVQDVRNYDVLYVILIINNVVIPLGVSFILHFSKLKSVYKKEIKNAYVMGVDQHHVYFSLKGDNTVEFIYFL